MSLPPLEDCKKILIVKPSSLGDIIHALPFVCALKNHYPHLELHWLVSSSFAPIIENHPAVDKLVLFHRGKSLQIFNRKFISQFSSMIKTLRSSDYDIVIDLQGLFRSGLFSFMTGCKKRLGPADAREGGSVFYTHVTGKMDEQSHAVDRNLSFCELLGFSPDKIPADVLPVPEEVSTQLESLLAHSVGSDWDNNRLQKLVSIFPGARWETKRWIPEKYTDLINKLQSDKSIFPVLVGSPSEFELCERIRIGAAGQVANLAGKTSLPVLAGLIGKSDLVICHDSAAAHIAVASNRKLLCISGPTNPVRTGPYKRMHDVVRLDLDCSPCYLRKLSKCPYNHKCMQDLEVQFVYEKAQERLNNQIKA